MSNFYTVEKRRHAWGDYYDLLLHGMSGHAARVDGLIQLERTGPFVPPISLPGIPDIVVTDGFRRELEGSGLVGLDFQPVIKKLIVHYEWHDWDMAAEEPAEYPEESEPENYVLCKAHSVVAADAMGRLWEVVLKRTAKVRRARWVCRREDISLLADSWQGEDIFLAKGVDWIYVTARGRDWLEEHAREYLNFEEAKTR